MTQWFDVSKTGLAKLLERRGKEWILYELIQNAWDQQVTTVKVSLTKQWNERVATVTVEDDDPNGFMDLSHAWTLFAESEKKQDPSKRGRFNVGEKLVLALCTEAEIFTTTGGVRFDEIGRHTLRRRRAAGSLITAKVRMTNTEFDECVIGIRRLIPPPNIVTTFVADRNDLGFNYDRVLPVRAPIAQFEATLATEIADPEGILRRSARKTSVAVHQPQEGEVGTLYEMGIPVVETGDTYHVDIGQKVPLNVDRDNVPPAYLRDVRTLVLNAVHDRIRDKETANANWVRDALSDGNITDDAVKTVVTLRFGQKSVAYDPSDSEANKRAVSREHNVITGSQLSKEEWANVRRAGVLIPAGRLFPSPKPYSTDPNAPPVKVIPEHEWNEAEQRTVQAVRRVSTALLGFTPDVRIVSTDNRFSAAYGGRCLDLNRRHLGRQWFADSLIESKLTVNAVSLLIHELGHEYCGDHLSSKYYEALTDLGAKLAHLVADNPKLLST